MWLLTLKSILVATDLAETSRSAMRTAAQLARLAGARLHLLHVDEGADADGEDGERLKREYERAAPEGPPPSSVLVVAGDPAGRIVERTEQVAADAIILGPHRRTRSDHSIGSTAADVVRDAPCPCLVAAGELELPLERVIAPVDLTHTTEMALSVALSWASALRPRGRKAHLKAFHVCANAEDIARATDFIGEAVQQVVARLANAARVEVAVEVVPGSDPAGEILHRLENGAVDLLVMAAGGPETVPFGSVAFEVVRGTSCPILLVPTGMRRRALDHGHRPTLPFTEL